MPDREHQAVDGGLEYSCGATRRTALGMEWHRERCEGGDQP